MRCLHCNKKLSLLKMAKGDDFCSPEHFDAHQLQESKNAIARLMSLPTEDTPRAPLNIGSNEPKPLEPAPEQPDEKIGMERLKAFADPPYAPFAISTLSSPPPQAPPLPLANGPDTSPQKLAYPIHDVESTACILNLYLRLNLSELAPPNWTSPGHLVVRAEDFRPEVIRQSLALSPDFTQLENPLSEALNVSELAPPIESVHPRPTAAPAETVTSIKPLEPVESVSSIKLVLPVECAKTRETVPDFNARLPFLIAPSFLERPAAAVPFDAASSSLPNPTTLPLIVDAGKPSRAHFSGAMPQSTRFAEITVDEPRDVPMNWIRDTPETAVLPVLLFPAPIEGGTHLSDWQRSASLIGLTSAALETSRRPMCELDHDLPSPLPVLPAATVPRNLAPEEFLARHNPVSRDIAARSGSFISIGALPEPEAPGSTQPIALSADLPRERVMVSGTFLANVLEMSPGMGGVMFVNPPSRATEFGWRPALAQPPALELTLTETWRNQAAYFSIPARITGAPELPKFPLEAYPYAPECARQEPWCEPAPSLSNLSYRSIAWQQTDSTMPPGATPNPAGTLAAVLFIGPSNAARKLEMPWNTMLPIQPERAFTAAVRVLVPEADLPSQTLTILPEVSDIPGGNVRIGLSAVSTTWDPSFLAPDAPPASKFLPVRKGPILPSARSWPRLGALPR